VTPFSAENLSDRLTFLIEYLDLPTATGDPDARWEGFQLSFLNNPSLFDIDLKSRQVGWSWDAAAEAVAEAKLIPRSTSLFVSINKEEAAEKIRYAKQIIEALDREARPKLIIDNRFEIEFENGSRLISHPCRPVRGKARPNIYLDEIAHYPNDNDIYKSAVPATTRGGRLRLGSSPLGASGVFWEIYEQKLRKYPGFTRGFIPWWSVASLCKDVDRARKLAPAMLTDERVRAFGTSRLVEIFENLLLEDFQQEYECAWLDEATAWVSWDEIKRNQLDAQDGHLWYRQVTAYGGRRETIDKVFDTIDELPDAIRLGKVEPVLAAGMDVGRHKHLSEIVIVGKPSTSQMPFRLGISLSGVEYEDQRAIAQRCLDRLPIVQLLIDRNGLGNQIAEDLNKQYGDRAVGVDFTNESKSLWAVELKVQMQRTHVPIPLDRDLSYQIHSIKKIVTSAKNAVFDTMRNEKHHADKFWALALAVWAARGDEVAQGIVVKYR
jgi:phage FluMu gp28-like protein